MIKPDRISSLTINEQLKATYQYHEKTIYELIDINITADQQPSWPFMMQISDEYITAPKRLLFIGQETYGWRNELPRPTVEKAMEFYAQVSNQDSFHNSPFWWFRKLAAERFKVTSNYAKASLWTNLSKIDVDKKRPTGKLFDNTMQLFINLLSQEIDIVQPDIILIFNSSGHYNWHINHYFSQESEYHKELVGLGVYKLYSKQLPINTFQVAHPNSLRYKKGSFTEKANTLIDIIENHIA